MIYTYTSSFTCYIYNYLHLHAHIGIHPHVKDIKASNLSLVNPLSIMFMVNHQ
jgi:hypothetical protein